MSKLMRSTAHCGILALFSSVVHAGPITTVPWNGYPGAASFTFDDACQSQLTNVVPALKSRKINATFYLYDVGNAFSNNKAAWVAAAKDGNELGNHTLTHADLSKAAAGTTEVSAMAAKLRAADPSIEAVTLAYPGCAVGSAAAVGADNFLARSCAFGSGPYSTLAWKNQPSDWLSVASVYVDDDNKATGPVLNALDAAKTNGGWFSTLNHGVGGDWIIVTPANVAGMFDRAIKDGLWVGTFQEVGAYWRASFTMDKVSVSGSSPWTITWTSPHPKMPKSVKLKVKLDAATFGSPFTVQQDNVVIPANTDGSYTIDFMKLKLSVTKGSTGVQDRIIYGDVRASVVGSSLQFANLGAGDYTLSLRSISGRLLERSPLHVASAQQVVKQPISVHGSRVLVVLEAPGKDARTESVWVP